MAGSAKSASRTGFVYARSVAVGLPEEVAGGRLPHATANRLSNPKTNRRSFTAPPEACILGGSFTGPAISASGSAPMPPDDVDEATQKQLQRLRIRGAPAVKPGMPNFVGEYLCKEVQVPSVRALQIAWAEGVTPTRAMLKEAFLQLETVASGQKLTVLGGPM